MRLAVLLALAVATGTVCAGVTLEQLADLYAKPSAFEIDIPLSQHIAESENAFAVRDKYPAAPIHILIISKKKIPTILQASPELIAEMIELAKRVAKQEGLETGGFRLVINTNPFGGQSVYHFHIHVLGGRQMKWPPG
jgi:histidine triad (HIT) family protein